MDVLYFLRDRLRFIGSFYTDAITPFEKIKKAIEAGEEPYIDNFDPESDYPEPPFLNEWQYADDCIVNLGRYSVMMLCSALKGYLEEFVKDIASFYGYPFPELSSCEAALKEHQKKNKGWLRGYQSFFLAVYKIDWNLGPKVIDSLEHLVLTRNDLEHNTDLISRHVSQTPYHHRKQANGIFADREMHFWDDEATLVVTQERLTTAIKSVEDFCEWLDSIRENHVQFKKILS